MNSEFVVRQAQGVADRLRGIETDDLRRIEVAYKLLYSRPPTDSEIAGAMTFLREQSDHYSGLADPRHRAWQDLCHTYLVSSEFLYVD